MTDRYVIRVQYERRGLRHTQFVLINAESQADAELILSEISAKGKVIGTQNGMFEKVEEMRALASATMRDEARIPEIRRIAEADDGALEGDL